MIPYCESYTSWLSVLHGDFPWFYTFFWIHTTSIGFVKEALSFLNSRTICEFYYTVNVPTLSFLLPTAPLNVHHLAVPPWPHHLLFYCLIHRTETLIQTALHCPPLEMLPFTLRPHIFVIVSTISHLTSFHSYLVSLMHCTHHYLLLFICMHIQPRVWI